ncbi:Isoleucine--tRNA ligase, partial [Frankliniella fusca]
AHSRPPEKPVQVSQGFGDTEVVHFTKLSFLLQYHRGIPAEDHSDTSLGSYQCDRKPLPASGAGGCFPVGPVHIQVQAGTTLICGWLPASLGSSGKGVSSGMGSLEGVVSTSTPWNGLITCSTGRGASGNAETELTLSPIG